MRQKEAQIAALKQHRRGGRRALLQGIASSVAAGVADCERRMAEEVFFAFIYSLLLSAFCLCPKFVSLSAIFLPLLPPALLSTVYVPQHVWSHAWETGEICCGRRGKFRVTQRQKSVAACAGQQMGAARAERAQPEAHLAGHAGGNAAARSSRRRLHRRQEPALLLALAFPPVSLAKAHALSLSQNACAAMMYPMQCSAAFGTFGEVVQQHAKSSRN